ncbi:Holliday junction resolvase RecU [Aureibacillus halotolerans]|uniref:Holliday junction resolvase RecU n=1 Tax=Aureibacillus halotolerans TaxID=1508390 RepID=A0A4R6TUD0_9BACI|nr:Holliday junction resolvase RecU [Aureibacillus halotolerans]TDQ35254.1 recombination protein U [Aureibacillus halotolerans]
MRKIKSSQANRGMPFEHLITVSNDMYHRKGIAVINKRPTPVKVLKVTGNKLIGHYEAPSTVDYDGVYAGRAICFEAKSVHTDTRFELKNLHAHQVQHLQDCEAQGAVCFLLIEFAVERKVFLCPFSNILFYVMGAASGGRKSIPRADFDSFAYEVKSGRAALDYLAVLDSIGGVFRDSQSG